LVQSAALRAVFPTADSTLPQGEFLDQVQREVNRVIGPDVFENIIVEPPSLEGMMALRGDEIGVDGDDDAVMSFRTMRLALFHFLLYARPQESISTIRERLPSYAHMGASASYLVDEFVRVVGQRAHVEIDVAGAWCEEASIMIAVTQLLPTFFHTLAEMGADEALVAAGIDKESGAEGDPIHQPGFWDEERGTIWNERWGRFTDDARFIIAMARSLFDVPRERGEYAALMFMRLVTAREHLDLIEFEQIAKIVAEECGDLVSPSGMLN